MNMNDEIDDPNRASEILNAIRARSQGSTPMSRIRKVPPEELRAKYPALQEAWEQYQVLLKLCSDQET